MNVSFPSPSCTNLRGALRPATFFAFAALCVRALGAPDYFDTTVKDSFVSQNSFLTQTPNFATPPSLSDVRDRIPDPYWSGHDDAIACYWRAWELAFRNLRPVTHENRFVSPYIEPAFNHHIFMWDSCFMLMFGRYGSRAFNFEGTLDNFYAKQHADGFICREIRESDGSDCFERFDPSSTGPNLMPWTEWEYFLNFNDRARLARVFPALLAYHRWFETYRAWPDGTYYSSGWGCGMDNQPRLPAGFSHEFSHGFMSWIDTTLQQIYAGRILATMAKALGREQDVAAIALRTDALVKFVNEHLWNDQQQFYFDRFRDGRLSRVKTIAAYWALLAGVVPDANLAPFIAHLENASEFNRAHRVPTLSADDPQFDPNGGYWRGSVWSPTTYMVLRGLTAVGRDRLAYDIARNHLDNVVAVHNRTGTLFENYAPDSAQGNDHRDFVGWTGISPISVLFEYVFGLRPDVPNNRIVWDVRLTEEFGVSRYPFGAEGVASFKCAVRAKPTDQPVVEIHSNQPLTVDLRWEGGHRILHVDATGIKSQ